MLNSELHTTLHLRVQLEERVVGQAHALEIITQRILSARAGLANPRRPVGVFLLAGPSGVGKTETAMALADILYGGQQNAVVLNMSEFQEPHSISGLKGSPPGYVGYGEGGVLTEAVRRRPYCLVLLEEMEKVCDAAASVDHGRVVAQGPISELAGGHARNELIIGVDDAELAERTLAGSPLVSELHQADGALRIVLPRDLDTAADLNAILVGAGVRVLRREPVRHSLEPRFLDVISGL